MENKQIEEMAKTVCHLDRTCDQCMTSFECKAMMYAKRFYNAGYRKASEVASEVIDDISNFLESRNGVGYVAIGIVELKHRLYELKKKYTEEGNDGT